MSIGQNFSFDPVTQRIYHVMTGPEEERDDVWSLNNLYTYFTQVFDDDVQMDDLPPMSAQTPTAFTLTNGWFIDPILLRYLNGGSLTTIGWDAASYDYGIRVLTFDAGGYVATAVDGTDIGKPVVYTDGNPTDSGTLLYADNTARKWWVRVDNTGDTFQSVEGISITSGTGAGTLSAVSETAEQTWANIFTLGTIADNTQIYLYQNDAQITPWWGTGHQDLLILVKDESGPIDYGYVTIFTRQYSKLYDHYTADLSAGARTPIPLATFADSNNASGYRQFEYTTGVGTFAVGDLIQLVGDSTVQGIVTAAQTLTPPYTLTYYLFKYPLTDFANTNAIETVGGAKTGTVASVPANVGPADLTLPITITFGAASENLNNGAGLKPYDVVVNCNNNRLGDVYEYLKYVTRYGETADIAAGPNHTIIGESYAAVGDIRFNYDNETAANFQEGEVVTGPGIIRGVIVSLIDNGDNGTMVLRDTSGNFTDGVHLTGATSTAQCDINGTVDTISPNKQAPFGAFAGGKFFGARGVWLSNVPSLDANNYQLIDSNNAAQVPPTSISITVGGIQSGDQVAVFVATGNNNIVNKNMYLILAAGQLTGQTYVRVNSDISIDTPTSGYVRVVRRDANGVIQGEEKYKYDSWTNSPNRQFNIIASVPEGLPGTTSYAYDATDTVYVPYIDWTADAITESVGIIYNTQWDVSPPNNYRYVTCRVRKSGILPYMITQRITDENLNITASRATDSIA